MAKTLLIICFFGCVLAAVEARTTTVDGQRLLNGGNSNSNNDAELYTGVKNVLAFGAKGDGLTDDSQSIQTALDSLTPGETLLFPPGQYLAAELLIPEIPDITLQGVGGGSGIGGKWTGTGNNKTSSVLVLKNDSAAYEYLLASSNYVNNRPWTGAPFTLSKLSFVGNAHTRQNASAAPGVVLMSWSTTVSDCAFAGFGRAGLIIAGVTSSGTIIKTTQVNSRYYRNNFLDNAGDGFAIVDPARNKNTDYYLQDNFAFSNGGNGFNLQTSAGALIEGNHLYSNAIFDININIASLALRVLHNYLEGPRGLRIETMDGSATIEGNYFEGMMELTANDNNSTVLSSGNNFGGICRRNDVAGKVGQTQQHLKQGELRTSEQHAANGMPGAIVGCVVLSGNRGNTLTLQSIGDRFAGPKSVVGRNGGNSPFNVFGDVEVLAAPLVPVRPTNNQHP